MVFIGFLGFACNVLGLHLKLIFLAAKERDLLTENGFSSSEVLFLGFCSPSAFLEKQ